MKKAVFILVVLLIVSMLLNILLAYLLILKESEGVQLPPSENNKPSPTASPAEEQTGTRKFTLLGGDLLTVDYEVTVDLYKDEQAAVTKEDQGTLKGSADKLVVTGENFKLTAGFVWEIETPDTYIDPITIGITDHFGEVYRFRYTQDNLSDWSYTNDYSKTPCDGIGGEVNPPCGLGAIQIGERYEFVECVTDKESGLKRCDGIVESMGMAKI